MAGPVSGSGRHGAGSQLPLRINAERFLVTVEADKVQGSWTDPRLARTTVEEWLPTWQASRAHLRRSTDVQAFVAHLEHKGLAPSTIRQAYLLVAGLFWSAVDSDLIARSPCRGIKLPPKTRSEMRFLTGDEV